MTARRSFNARAAAAIGDPALQKALLNVKRGFVEKRAAAVARLPEFDTLRDEAKAIKSHTLKHLDLYLEVFESKVTECGGHVHYAPDAAEARRIVLKLCREAKAKLVTKSKSMVSEEIGLNHHLAKSGIEIVETDLGEYIVQIRKEAPSHLIAPVIHLSKEAIAADFRKAHGDLPSERSLGNAVDLVAEARAVLREKFLAADVGITGANLLIAETGTSVVVTNEGNADLTQTLPRTHVVVASIEKLVPTLEDACTLLRLLARSGTGQEITTYTTFATGPKRVGDPDGPSAYHVILLDNGRSELLGGSFNDMLACIRCGACLNHCPVYGVIGGHAYGTLYTGPMGAVLSPALDGLASTRDLPSASTLCGRCQDVCPVRIPLPSMLREWRMRGFARHLSSRKERLALKLWSFAAKRPKLYHRLTRVLIPLLALLAGSRRSFRALPFASAWTRTRDLPAPEGRTFHWVYARRRAK
jgi:L-lactate dehydrogenase complex protein LldF